ncbi:MAG: beta-lactamase family protein [Clostridia bacterium]|nr:beta-lactamase family protein [Clostridia bacterium]
MSNALFDAVLSEDAPMYDCAVITERGTEVWKNPVCHSLNNSHSVTKLFTATLIGQLWDKGELCLDDPVTKFFSAAEMGVPADSRWREVTVRDALQHKTGIEIIPHELDEDESAAVIGDDFLGHVFSLRIMHAPGTFYRYSDEAYYLLARIAAKVSGLDGLALYRERIMKPLDFGQWSMVLCPMGYPLGCGGFFARSVDIAKLGFAYAMDGVYAGKQIISPEWIRLAMQSDFALQRHRGTDVFVKTGSRGQMAAFSMERHAACAWHGCSSPDDNGRRNDRLLDGFLAYLDESAR